MKLRGSHLVALAILAAIAGWMYTGKLMIGGQEDPNRQTIAEREAGRTNEAFRVRVTDLQPSERLSVLQIRGRTEADSLISVRAETGGTFQQIEIPQYSYALPCEAALVLGASISGVAAGPATSVSVELERLADGSGSRLGPLVIEHPPQEALAYAGLRGCAVALGGRPAMRGGWCRVEFAGDLGIVGLQGE